MPKSRKKLHRRLAGLLTGANVAGVAALWLSALSTHVAPADHPLLPVLGLMFPLFAVGVGVLLVLSLVLRRRLALIPAAGLLLCWSNLRAYCPINLPRKAPAGALKVISFNTQGFGGPQEQGKGRRNAIVQYMLHSGADIICYQEGSFSGWDTASVELRKVYPYGDRTPIAAGAESLGLLSKYPIVGIHRIHHEGGENASYCYRLLLAAGDTLWVVNNYLQSNRLTLDERAEFKEMVKRPDEADIGNTSHSLASKIGHAGLRRAVQTDSLVAFLDRHSGASLILAGDLNDTPVSYTHRQLTRRLADAHTACGLGPGYSFNRDGILVRIDNLMATPDWRPYDCHIDRSIKQSDHYPIVSSFVRTQKP